MKSLILDGIKTNIEPNNVQRCNQVYEKLLSISTARQDRVEVVAGSLGLQTNLTNIAAHLFVIASVQWYVCTGMYKLCNSIKARGDLDGGIFMQYFQSSSNLQAKNENVYDHEIQNLLNLSVQMD